MTLKNTDSRFKISVINTQTIDGQTDTVSESGEGSYRLHNGKYFISYECGGTKSFLRLFGDRLSVTRRGETSSEIVYEVNESFEFDYNTMYGKIHMAVTTKLMTYDLDENGGKICLSYELKTGSDIILNKMIIKIKRI